MKEGMDFGNQVFICVMLLLLVMVFYLWHIVDVSHKSEKERNPGMQAGLFVTLDQSSQSFYITRMVKDGDKEKVCIVQNRAIPEEYFENCVTVDFMEGCMKANKGRITKTNIYRR